MRVLLCVTLAVGLIAVVSTLSCNVCEFRALSICFTGSKTESCTGNCSITRATIGTTSLFSKQICSPSCVPVNDTKDNIFNYHYNTVCCTTDQCNSGNSIKVSFSLGLGMILLWLLNAV